MPKIIDALTAEQRLVIEARLENEKVAIATGTPIPTIVTVCDCGAEVFVRAPLLPDAKTVCKGCAKAAAKGKPGAVIKHRVARHVPRVVCEPEELAAADAKAKQRRKVDIQHTTDPALGEVLREAVAKAEANRVKAADKAIKAARKEKEKADRLAIAEEQVSRKVVPGFTSHGVAVPDLDMTANGWDETPTAVIRSPYNKVLHRSGQPLLNSEMTTFAVLVKVHKKLSKNRVEAPVDKPKKKQKTDKGAAAMARKIEALMGVGMTRKQALKFLDEH